MIKHSELTRSEEDDSRCGSVLSVWKKGPSPKQNRLYHFFFGDPACFMISLVMIWLSQQDAEMVLSSCMLQAHTDGIFFYKSYR